MLTQSTRPKCKADTHYVPTPDGVYLRGNNNRLVLKGKSLYSLLARLMPNLTGNITLEELTAGLDADRKRMVTNLLEKLFAHQFLQDAEQDQPHTLRPLELETYASNIAFIESLQASAAYRFECFRNKRFLLIGSGPGLSALVQTGLQCGARKIGALVTPENETTAGETRQDVLDLFADAGSEENARLLDALSWENEAEVRATIQAYDAVLHIAGEPALARARLLNRLCIEQQKVCIQAVTVDGSAWIGPLVQPEANGCWECAWRRLQANLTDLASQFPRYAFHDRPLVSGERALTMAGATIVASRLVFELFQYLTQTGPTETVGKLSAIDLATLLSESHTFLPHPHCLACQHPVAPTASQFLARVRDLWKRSSIDANSFLEDFVACGDDRLGLFRSVDMGNLVQAPLAVYRIHLSNPLPEACQAGSSSVVAVNVDTREASIRAAQKACERYAASFVDQRRLLSSETVQQSAFPVISTGEARTRAGELWTWALDLRTRQACAVPASAVFAAPGASERGVASGKTWEEALCLALLDRCNELTVKHARDVQQAYPRVDLAQVSMTSEGTHLVRLLQAAGARIAVYDVTGALQVPTFATCLDEKIVACTSDCDSARALCVGLEQALRQYQSAQFQQPDYALPPVPDLPENLRGTQLSVPHYTLPDEWSDRLEWLLGRLRANGWSAFAVPLDHDAALVRVLPFIARVILSSGELEKGE